MVVELPLALPRNLLSVFSSYRRNAVSLKGSNGTRTVSTTEHSGASKSLLSSQPFCPLLRTECCFPKGPNGHDTVSYVKLTEQLGRFVCLLNVTSCVGTSGIPNVWFALMN